MMFEPCGDLKKDYGAYCETLRLTEREEVYKALHTTVPREISAIDSQVGGGGATLTERLLPKPPGAAAGEKGPDKARRTSAAASSNRKAAGKGKEAAAAEGGAIAAEAGRAAGEPAMYPMLTYISMRHPVFCINQRDITPLCRAMPHCPSLVSVQLVGCGLSVEAYMLLVEAVYRSQRLVAVEVDFNATPRAGFVTDPTLVPAIPPHSHRNTPPVAPTLEGAAASTAGVAADSDEAAREPAATDRSNDNDTSEVAAIAAAAAAAAATEGQRKGSARSSVRSKGNSSTASKRPSKRVSGAAAAAAAAEAAAAALVATDDPGAIYLKPTEFCGLHRLPTPLEEQVVEERDKKGKVDAKKVMQLQAQFEAMREFDLAHRLRVPRGWHGLLYTGLRHLSLRGNGISDDVVRDMVDAVLGNPLSRLTTLNLWGNEVTDCGAAHLARLLRSNFTLRALDLGRNQLSDEGVLILVDCFRMREVASSEELNRYRQAVLTRPGATPEERHAATLDAAAVLPAQQHQPSSGSAQQQGMGVTAAIYPSYQDMYRVWHATHRSTPTPVPSVDVSANVTSASAGEATAVASTSSGSARRGGGGGGGGGGAGAGKAKSPRNESTPPLPTALSRPTTPFDRDCVRVLPTADSPVRVPGNTTLEVLNLGENAHVTVTGASEAARRLGLHEPRTDEEMVALVTSSSGDHAHEQRDATRAAAGTPFCPPLNAVVEAPEPHCAGLRLRSCVVYAKRYADTEAEWPEMAAAQRALNAALDSWAPDLALFPTREAKSANREATSSPLDKP